MSAQIKYSIHLKNIRFFGYHGVKKSEIKSGNYFNINLCIEVRTGNEIVSDRLADALNYEDVFHIVMDEVRKRANLLEHLAYRISRKIADRFPDKIEKIIVEIEKSFSPELEMHATPSVVFEYVPEG